MIKPDIIDAIISLQPNYKVSVNNSNDRENFEVEWYSYTPLKKTDIQSKYDELLSDYNKNSSVIENRKKEYGSLEEQLEYIVENGIDAFITKQKNIKSKYPKS
tara:strand:+ start:426 stop:734 length:309 start_codon:yes stop_codon:yes gene_type:complete